jgi:hypothetical protein
MVRHTDIDALWDKAAVDGNTTGAHFAHQTTTYNRREPQTLIDAGGKVLATVELLAGANLRGVREGLSVSWSDWTWLQDFGQDGTERSRDNLPLCPFLNALVSLSPHSEAQDQPVVTNKVLSLFNSGKENPSMPGFFDVAYKISKTQLSLSILLSLPLNLAMHLSAIEAA